MIRFARPIINFVCKNLEKREMGWKQTKHDVPFGFFFPVERCDVIKLVDCLIEEEEEEENKKVSSFNNDSSSIGRESRRRVELMHAVNTLLSCLASFTSPFPYWKVHWHLLHATTATQLAAAAATAITMRWTFHQCACFAVRMHRQWRRNKGASSTCAVNSAINRSMSCFFALCGEDNHYCTAIGWRRRRY